MRDGRGYGHGRQDPLQAGLGEGLSQGQGPEERPDRQYRRHVGPALGGDPRVAADFYARAVADSLIDPIGQPDINITAGEEEGQLTFEAEVEVRPEISIKASANYA